MMERIVVEILPRSLFPRGSWKWKVWNVVNKLQVFTLAH